jgi:uncharacterized membrane protein
MERGRDLPGCNFAKSVVNFLYCYSKGSVPVDKRTTDIVAYLTWVGLVVALIFGDRENSKFHLNQALVIWLAGIPAVIPCIGWLWGIFCFICAVIGCIGAINGEETEVPLLGKIRLLK